MDHLSVDEARKSRVVRAAAAIRVRLVVVCGEYSPKDKSREHRWVSIQSAGPQRGKEREIIERRKEKSKEK